MPEFDVTPRVPTTTDDMLHLAIRMIERQVSWMEIVAIVAAPQKSVAGHSGRVNHYGIVNGRRLRVTIDATGVVWTVAIASS